MSGLRSEMTATLSRWQEVIFAAAMVLVGGWVSGFGGWFYAGLGWLIGLAGLAIGLIALRRLRFRPSGQAPGVVQMVEGQVAYFGPEEGGFVALRELEEIRLEPCAAGRCWVLVPAEGAPLEVPAAARGAEVLYDAFAMLPGIDMQAVLAALHGAAPRAKVIWRRRPRPALT